MVFKYVAGAEVIAGRQNRVQQWQDGLRIVRGKLAERGLAFRHPGPLVEQLRGLEKGVEVCCHQLPAGSGQLCHCVPVSGGSVVVAKEFQLAVQGHGNSWVGSHSQRGVRHLAAVLIGAVRSAGLVEHEPGVAGGLGENADAVETAAGTQHAGVRKQSAARFQANQVIEGGRHAARACGVRSECKGNQPFGHRNRGTG